MDVVAAQQIHGSNRLAQAMLGKLCCKMTSLRVDPYVRHTRHKKKLFANRPPGAWAPHRPMSAVQSCRATATQ